MHIRYFLPLILSLLAAGKPAKREYDTHDYYVLEHAPSQLASLAEVASSLGLEVVEQVGELKDHWLARTHQQSNSVDARHSDLRARAQAGLSHRDASLANSIRSIARQHPKRRTKRAPPPIRPGDEVETENGSESEGENEGESARAIAARLGFEDPLFDKQWHLVNDQDPVHMMNVVPVWEMGITGKGVITSLIDDGLDYTSEDLKANFDADDSHDFNDHEDLPYPKNSDDKHGTRCAGQIAAGKNTQCGVGIAYDSKVAGVRILSGDLTDADEAAALNYGYQNVSIYSCSWGPNDDGKTMEAPDSLIKKAIANGVTKGRQGKGSVFVFASGNGGYSNDQCNFDGYTNSIFSVTVSAVDHKGQHPAYSEGCTANMIAAYSSGGGKSITTTDKGENACTSNHGGTSAAAPNAAAVFALAPDLTWRDIQYLCIQTARQINPDDETWNTTAAGRPYSNKFGFGVLDGFEYVKAAKDWTSVKPQTWIRTPTVQLADGRMDANLTYSGGEFISDSEDGIRSTIEVTQEMVWIEHTKRGDVEVELVSPGGVRSVLAEPRKEDMDGTGFPGWTFMSVKHWGENPVGDWTIRVWDQNTPAEQNGTFLGWNMVLFGSSVDPSNPREWKVLHDDHLLPPVDGNSEEEEDDMAATPTDHEEVASAVVSATSSQSASVSPSSSAAPSESDEGLLSYISSKYPILLLLMLVIFALAAGIVVWAYRRRRASAGLGGEYSSLPADEEERHPMRDVGGTASRGRVQLPADDDADESSRMLRSTENVHEDFLEDDDPTSPATATVRTPTAGVYRDDPERGSGR